MRVLDLGIDIPDFGPIPGVVEKRGGNVPQRVAFLHGVLLGRAGRQWRPLLDQFEALLRLAAVALPRLHGRTG